ncbi:MAG: hypothetical protein K2X32_04990 [Phycisphaerales bacterium]|nr:hypothetical protein [Phycisphaerales bacterium]
MIASSPMTPAELRRLRFAAWLGRLQRWEFWSAWWVYAPLLPWIVWHALRSRHPMGFTAVNPAIPAGGAVGESKSQILAALRGDRVLKYQLLVPGPIDTRMATLEAFITRSRTTWPIILKPDIGERGTGVRRIASSSAARAYLERFTSDVIAQVYHPGPREVGVFYARVPGESRGRILGVTAKHFPSVIGDGRSSVRELIWRHPRLRFQAAVFLDRLGADADRCLGAEESLQLGVIGNHCRGTMFTDAPDLATADLARAMDEISADSAGIEFGRFDLRYADDEELRRGRGFAVVEFNGVFAENTSIYDPNCAFWSGQRTLREQWKLACEIGARRVRAGARATGPIELLRMVWAHRRRPGAGEGSD